MTQTRALSVLLLLSAVNLALMVPGGFVETRTFPGYGVAVLAAFNVFLTLLGLGTLVLACRVLRSGRAGALPVIAGTGFVLVYVLDLLKIFPVAEAPMSATLATMEWIGTVLGLAVVVLGLRSSGQGRAGAARLPLWLLVAMAVVAVVIVTFATFSAM